MGPVIKFEEAPFMNDMVYETEVSVEVKIYDNELINQVEIYEPVILTENYTNKAQLTSQVIETLENINFKAPISTTMEKIIEAKVTKEEHVNEIKDDNEKEPVKSRETIHITESNLNVTLPSTDTSKAETMADPIDKNLDSESNIKTKIADSECAS